MGVRSVPASPEMRPSSCDRTPRASSMTALLQATQNPSTSCCTRPTTEADSPQCDVCMSGIQELVWPAGDARSSCRVRAMAGQWAQDPHLLTQGMPVFSFTMLPSLASSTASVSFSAFFFKNFFKPAVECMHGAQVIQDKRVEDFHKQQFGSLE